MSASHNPGGPDYDWGIKVTSNTQQVAAKCLSCNNSLKNSTYAFSLGTWSVVLKTFLESLLGLMKKVIPPPLFLSLSC